MLEAFLDGEDIVFCDKLGFETDKFYLRREGEPEIIKKYIGGGGMYQTVFSICIRTGTGDSISQLTALAGRLSHRPLPASVICFEILKSPHIVNNSAATSRHEMKCRIIYANS